jgi:hypothetical protein
MFQSPDVSRFGNFNKEMNNKIPLESDETTTDFIKRIFQMVKQTLVEDNVRSAFLQIGLQYGQSGSSGDCPWEDGPRDVSAHEEFIHARTLHCPPRLI